MARTVVWATQGSWQRLVGYAYTTEEELLKNTPTASHLASQNFADTVKKEEDVFGVSAGHYDMEPGSPRRKVPKLEHARSDGYQMTPGRLPDKTSSLFPVATSNSDFCFASDCSLPAIENHQGLKYCSKHCLERPGHGYGKDLMDKGLPFASDLKPPIYDMRSVNLRCQHPGCEKFSTPAEDGDRAYCLSHMRGYGQQPVLKRRKCQHPACQKQARKSSEGQTLYCKGHMKQHGLSPNVPKCQHVNCEKQAQLSVDGQTLFCKVHMKENGLIPRQRVCAEGNCQKRVKQSLQGPGMFCIAHMKQHGLTPKLRLCQHSSCSKQAVPDVEGKRMYCVAHMKEHGMEPYFRLRKCQAPNCDKKAKSDGGGKKTFCSFHAKVFEELQNTALANYHSDIDEEEE